jgi:predicted ester cyclase
VTDLAANKLRSKRLYQEVFGDGNYAAADDLLAPDHVSHVPGAPAESGVEHIKRQAMLLRTAIPDMQVHLEDQVGEGDRVASRWRGSGTHSGPLQLPIGAVPPTGNPVDFGEMRIDLHVDGRIIESWFIPDRMTLWQQLGLLPTR